MVRIGPNVPQAGIDKLPLPERVTGNAENSILELADRLEAEPAISGDDERSGVQSGSLGEGDAKRAGFEMASRSDDDVNVPGQQSGQQLMPTRCVR
jgi:hypothetical protein